MHEDMAGNFTDTASGLPLQIPVDPFEDVNKSIDQWLTVALLLVGIPGNIVCLSVWLQNDRHNTSRIYLASVALADLGFMSCYFVYQLQKAWDLPTIDHPGICNVFPVVVFTFRDLSPLSALAFSVERFISVYFPFQRLVYCTVRRAKMAVVGLTCFTLATSLPYAYFYTIRYQPWNGKEECAVRSSLEEDGMMSVFSLYTVVVAWTCFILGNCSLLVVNILVFIKIRRKTNTRTTTANARHRKIKNYNGDERDSDAPQLQLKRNCNKNCNNSERSHFVIPTRRPRAVTTATLLGVSFLQILTTMPVSIVFVHYTEVSPDHLDEYGTQAEVDAVYEVFYHFNHVVMIVKQYAALHYSIKVFVYLLTSAPFRRKAKRLFSLRHFRWRRVFRAEKNKSSAGQTDWTESSGETR